MANYPGLGNRVVDYQPKMSFSKGRVACQIWLWIPYPGEVMPTPSRCGRPASSRATPTQVLRKTALRNPGETMTNDRDRWFGLLKPGPAQANYMKMFPGHFEEP